MTAVLWFRRDLRLADLPALHAAAQGGAVAPLFVFDERLLRGRWASANRAAFLVRCLESLDADLRARGNLLHLRFGRPESAVPEFARDAGATSVFVSRDYTPFGRSRDRAVARELAANGVGFNVMPGNLVHEPESVLTGTGKPFSVFTPFFKRWRAMEMRPTLERPDRVPGVRGLESGTIPPQKDLTDGTPVAGLPVAGEDAARSRLARFVANGLADYRSKRDFPAEDGTSRLSQDLRWGLLSPAAVASATGGDEKFLAELAWRDFYAHALWHYPRLRREPFQEKYAVIAWDRDTDAFDAWRAGRTGFPIVDAGMRELLATGHMHNRIRMICASFLAKDLHIDWRLGEAHFMRHLVDGDPASNNGGWQWAASVGTDAQPYFRVFNPWLQGKKFDPDGVYIRRWVPELRQVADRHVHEPALMTPEEQASAGCVIGRDYPAPIVDHRFERVRAIAMYRAATTGSGR